MSITNCREVIAPKTPPKKRMAKFKMASNRPKKQRRNLRQADEIRCPLDPDEGFEMEDETRHPTRVSLDLQHRNLRAARREATLFQLGCQTALRIIFLVDQM